METHTKYNVLKTNKTLSDLLGGSKLPVVTHKEQAQSNNAPVGKPSKLFNPLAYIISKDTLIHIGKNFYHATRLTRFQKIEGHKLTLSFFAAVKFLIYMIPFSLLYIFVTHLHLPLLTALILCSFFYVFLFYII